MVGGRLGAVFESGVGVEASATVAALAGILGELSVVGALEPLGQTVLLRAGLTGIDAPRATEHSSPRASTGFPSVGLALVLKLGAK